MKKEKNESPAKVARKKAKDSIESRLTKTLKSITAELGQEVIDIEKTAKKLAKKDTTKTQPPSEKGNGNTKMP